MAGWIRQWIQPQQQIQKQRTDNSSACRVTIAASGRDPLTELMVVVVFAKVVICLPGACLLVRGVWLIAIA